MAAPTQSATARDFAVNALLQGAIGAARLLPYGPRVRTVGAFTERVVAPLAGYTARAEENLARVYPAMSATARRRIARAVANNAGRTLIETYSHAGLMARAKAAPITGPGLEAAEAARAAGRPVLFVTGHFGNHDVARYALTARGFRIGGLYRPMTNAFFNAHYVRTLADVSGPVFAQGGDGIRSFIQELRAGGMMTLLFDINARGATLPFLGLPARTSLATAEVALKVGADVIPYYGIRQEDGLSFAIEMDAPIAPDTPEAMLLQMNASLEARIARYPDQWFWIHRRWKVKRRSPARA